MVNGFLNIDKPQGITSFDVVARVRRALDVKKVGHLGTLDPLATGVLVVAVGEGTKLIEYMMGADKDYEVELEFGKVSDTYDRDGKVEVCEEVPKVGRSDLEEVLKDFVGKIDQVPPAFSALKVNGKRAYNLARKGEKVELKSRKVQIDSIDILEFEGARAVLRVQCGSGTYIRSLVHDLGQKLGCGAIMTELRRTRVGSFLLDDAVEDPTMADLIPLEEVVRDWPSVTLTESEVTALHHGQKVHVPEAWPQDKQSPVVAFYNDKLVSLVEEKDGFLRPIKNFSR